MSLETESSLENVNGVSILIDISDHNVTKWNELWEKRKTAESCDIQLRGYDGVLSSAHTCVLANASEFLREAVSQQSQNPAITPIIILQIPALCSTVIDAILSFLYTGKMCISASYLGELRLAADILNLEKLQQICNAFDDGEIIDSLDPSQTTLQISTGDSVVAGESCNQGVNENITVRENTKSHQQVGTIIKQNLYVGPERQQAGRKPINDMNGFDCRINYCTAWYASLNELFTHRQESHDAADYEFCCHICGRAFKFKHNIKPHIDRHMERTFQCSDCDKSFSTKADLGTHRKTHTGQKPFKCDYCDKRFSQSGNLLKHKRSVHNDVFMSGQRLYECTECTRSFKTNDMLAKHKKRHTQKFTCSLCQQDFRLRKKLLEHQKQEHGEEFLPAEGEQVLEVYECDQCQKGFLNIKSLTLHQQTVHDKSKRFSCPHQDCKYQAYFKYAIDRHYKKHTRNPAQSCGVLLCPNCQLAFPTEKHFAKHECTTSRLSLVAKARQSTVSKQQTSRADNDTDDDVTANRTKTT